MIRSRTYKEMDDVPNRTLCDALEEMRNCLKTNNFSYLGSLIEEAQSMAARMEAKIWDQNDFDSRQDRYREQKAKINELVESEKALDARIRLKTMQVPKGFLDE